MWTLGHYIFHLTSFFSNVIITIGPRGSPACAKLLCEAFSEHHSVTLKAPAKLPFSMSCDKWKSELDANCLSAAVLLSR